jgi:PKD repeat protein
VDTTSFYITTAAKTTARIGSSVHPNPNDSLSYENLIIPNRFNVYEPVVLDSVAVYVQSAPATFDIILSDISNPVIARKTVTVNRSKEKVFVPLGFTIMPGTNYDLSLDNIGQNRFLVDETLTYPITTTSGVAELVGTPFTGVSFNYFYDWHLSYALQGCYSGQFDSFVVNVSLPVDLQDSVYACDSILINATATNAISYTWSNGAVNPTVQLNSDGIYYVTISDASGCILTDSIEVEIADPIVLPAGLLCGSRMNSNYNFSNATSFLWNTGETTPTAIVNNVGTFSLTVTNIEGCVLSGSTTINQLEPLPFINLPSLINTCNDTLIDAGFFSQNHSYLWSSGATTQTLNINNSGNYFITVTSPNNCSSTDSFFVNRIPLPQAEFNSVISNRSVRFTNNSTNATNYFWEFGDSTTSSQRDPFHLYTNSGCYIVTLTVGNNCGSDQFIDTIAVDINPTFCSDNTGTELVKDEISFINLFPNPARDIINVELESKFYSDADISIITMEGKELMQSNHQIQKGKNLINIPLSDINSGFYIVRLKISSSIIFRKIVINKN